MTLRTFYALMGLMMMAPQLWFLILFRPPGGMFHYSPSSEKFMRPFRRVVNDVRYYWNYKREDLVLRHARLAWLPTFGIWRPYPPTEGWWIGAVLRIQSMIIFIFGSRYFFVNLANGDKPIMFDGWYDVLHGVLAAGIGGIGSVLFLAVYLRYRNWGA